MEKGGGGGKRKNQELKKVQIKRQKKGTPGVRSSALHAKKTPATGGGWGQTTTKGRKKLCHGERKRPVQANNRR